SGGSAGAVHLKGGAADGEHVPRNRRVRRRRALVARGGDEGDARVPGGGGEVEVERRFTREFARTPAHGHGDHPRLAAGEIHGGEQVAQAVVIGFDEEDGRPRGDGVGPLDVQGDLTGPPGVGRRQG